RVGGELHQRIRTYLAQRECPQKAAGGGIVKPDLVNLRRLRETVQPEPEGAVTRRESGKGSASRDPPSMRRQGQHLAVRGDGGDLHARFFEVEAGSWRGKVEHLHVAVVVRLGIPARGYVVTGGHGPAHIGRNGCGLTFHGERWRLPGDGPNLGH